MALSLEAKVIIGLAIGAAGIGVVVLSSKPSSQAAPKNSPAPNASSVGQQREGFFPTQPIASWAVTLSPGDMGSMDVNLGDSIQLYTPDGESIYSVLSLHRGCWAPQNSTLTLPTLLWGRSPLEQPKSTPTGAIQRALWGCVS